MDTNSYGGITLNSAISKVLESLILDRLEPLFMEAGMPHPNQRQHISPSFTLGRGVRQGYILSPALVLLVKGPLLRQLQSQSIGASVNNTYAREYQ